MRLLILAGLALAAFFLAVPWIKGLLADSGFRQDMAVTPMMIDSRKGASASVIATAVRARALERGIALPEDGLKVQVSAAHKGSEKVAAGVMRVNVPGVSQVQDVTIDASYDQPVLKVFKRHVQTEVMTAQPGEGPGSVYPEPPAAPPAP
jgi:hypothetical protein